MNISRRTILRGFGTAIALPWMESLACFGELNRASSQPPTRLAFIYLPNGMRMNHWTPQGKSESGFETPKIFKPVDAFMDQATIVSGLALSGADPHGDGAGDHARSVAAFLTGAHPRKTAGSQIKNGKSIDQVVADQIGHLTRFRSLELGTESSSKAGRCDSGYSCAYTSNISWRTATSPMSKEMDPSSLFDRLFGGFQQRENKIARNQRITRRKSILDFVRQEANQLHSRLSKNDRQKMDEYLFAVRDIEKRLGKVEKLAEPEFDLSDFQRPLGVPASYGEHVKLMFDMMVLAFQTDSTRVISFMFANAGSNRSYREIGVRGGHHDISHHGNAMAKLKKITQINTYHMSLFRHFLDRLQNVKEGEATLLDHSMIMYGSGIADGDRHNHRDLPIALFGGAGGNLKSGRHIRVRSGTPLTNLYCSMMDRMGVRIESFADSSGRIDAL